MKYIKATLWGLFAAGIVYLCVAFIFLTLDFTEWHISGRCIFGILGGIIFGMVFSFTIDNIENQQQ